MKFSSSAWHEHFKREFLPEICANGVEKWEYLPSGQRVLKMSTTDLNTAEFVDYITQIEAYVVGELDVKLIDRRWDV